MFKVKSSATIFLILATPFYLNDIGFIALGSTYNVYVVDYGTRVFVLTLCFLWPTSRAIAMERLFPQAGVPQSLLCVTVLSVLILVVSLLLMGPLNRTFGVGQLFQFPSITNPNLFWLDLTLGLFIVALSEELIFRKFARRWLKETGRTSLQVVVISAFLFALAHWGSGLVWVIYNFAIGIVYMAVYFRLGRLWPLVLAHWTLDFFLFGAMN